MLGLGATRTLQRAVRQWRVRGAVWQPGWYSWAGWWRAAAVGPAGGNAYASYVVIAMPCWGTKFTEPERGASSTTYNHTLTMESVN